MKQLRLYAWIISLLLTGIFVFSNTCSVRQNTFHHLGKVKHAVSHSGKEVTHSNISKDWFSDDWEEDDDSDFGQSVFLFQKNRNSVVHFTGYNNSSLEQNIYYGGIRCVTHKPLYILHRCILI